MKYVTSTIKINNMTLNNRIVMPPMDSGKSPDGLINADIVEHYKARAKGGQIGLIITEHYYISMQGKASPKQISIASDEVIEPMKALTEAIHMDGTKAVCQISHAGRATHIAITGMPQLCVSKKAEPADEEEAAWIEVTKADIARIQDEFVAAALRAKAAGYDGVELHSAHGYFMNQFYSPLTNSRHDEYGVDRIENRVRFQVETIKKVRAAVGPDYPIFIRFGGCDYMEGGSTIEDAVKACMLFEEAGVDCIDLTGGMCIFTRKDVTTPGWFKDLSLAVKEKVSVPVLLTGGVKTGADAENLLEEGAADLIGVGRGLFMDARWAEKNL